MTYYIIKLQPIEPLFFRDSRSALAGEDHAIMDSEPYPQTIFGAIGTNIAQRYNVDVPIQKQDWNNSSLKTVMGEFLPNFESGCKNCAELLGFWYCDEVGKDWFPRPLHLNLKDNGGIIQIGTKIELTEIKGAGFASSIQELSYYLELKNEETEDETPAFISKELLTNVLIDELQKGDNIIKQRGKTRGQHYLPEAETYKAETRTGLGMDNSRNATQKGLLFYRPYRRFNHSVGNSGAWRTTGITACLKTLDTLQPNRPVPFAFLGGDGGRAKIDYSDPQTKKPFQDIRDTILQNLSGKKGFMVYLLTPAIYEGDWPQVAGVTPIAAAIGKEKYYSGWWTNSPSKTYALIPRGSVFFYEWPPEIEQKEIEQKKVIDDNWLEPLSEKFRNSGFGRMMIGVWS